jgi:CTP:molybdopterin cytidylyltransferase MocA
MQDPDPKSDNRYPQDLDAIVLAGTDDNPRRMIQGQNKAFLDIGGQVLVRRAVEALLQAKSIGRIYVVGPFQRLKAALADLPREVVVVEQSGKMLANAWQAIHASEADHRAESGGDDPARPLLFISSDLPLVSAEAVDDYVVRCAAEDRRAEAPYAMLAGVAEEASLKSFYPGGDKAGIVRPYVHLNRYRVRLANIYVGRPRLLSNQAFLQVGFDHRKAEKWKNVIYLAGHFLSQAGGWQAAWATVRLQATLIAARWEGGVYERMRKGNDRERIERICSTVMGGPIRMVVTPYGGLSLDVDNEEDFQILSDRFEEWAAVGPAGETPGSV